MSSRVARLKSLSATWWCRALPIRLRSARQLGCLIAPWHNVVGLEMLPYHTMGVVKYEQLGIPYKLEGVPQMDTARMPELRNAVMTGMKKRRAELKNAIG